MPKAPQWTDLEHASVVNLDGSDPKTNLKAVPRLVASKWGEKWRTYCVTDPSNQNIPEMAPEWPTREEAKLAVVDFARRTLDQRYQDLLKSL